jgi:hypothetical protein
MKQESGWKTLVKVLAVAIVVFVVLHLFDGKKRTGSAPPGYNQPAAPQQVPQLDHGEFFGVEPGPGIADGYEEQASSQEMAALHNEVYHLKVEVFRLRQQVNFLAQARANNR